MTTIITVGDYTIALQGLRLTLSTRAGPQISHEYRDRAEAKREFEITVAQLRRK